MFSQTILLGTLLLTTSTLAVPLTTRQTTSFTPYHGISLHVDTNPPGEPETASPAPVEIAVLTPFSSGVKASKLTFDTGVAINVDINYVECRAYKDAEGLEVLGGAFSLREPAVLSTTGVVEVGSVLCYVV